MELAFEKIKSGNSELDSKIKEFLTYSQDVVNKSYVQDVMKLVEKKKYDTLEKMMMNRLTFGTAGLRGVMGPGYAALNDLVIVQTSQGIANILSEEDKMKGVIIGHDNRHNSQRFADLVATTFLLCGFKVYLFSSITPTPYVPYTVRKLNCCLGIMITASHNPKNDNGYKVYGSNGAQIQTDVCECIQESILKHLKPNPGSFDTSLVWTSAQCSDPLAKIDCMYMDDLLSTSNSCLSGSKLKITFTAMHGVGHSFLKKAFQNLHYEHFIAVKEQMYPDPDFPTVKFPNPEEQNSLDLAKQTADANDSTLILANDPDADRLEVAEKLPNGKWFIYSGNQIGALLGAWLWKNCSPDKKSDPSKCFMVSSTVSSKILRSIAKKEGFVFYETLTGFKFMANKAYDAMMAEMTFLFAFEEAIGFMVSSSVLDKDGILTAIQIAEMAASLEKENKLLHDFLKEVYAEYGYHVGCNSYFISNDPAATDAMFDNLRQFNGNPQQYPKCLENGDSPFLVKYVRDLATGYDSSQPNKKAIFPYQKMITFYFENGCEATIRTSGTEPKVKYYTEMIAKVPETEWTSVKETLHMMVDLMIDQWFQPKKYGFSDKP